MKRLGALLSVLWLCACAALSGGEAGWTTLIDGERGLDNFDRVGDANWRAEGGAIVADRGKGGVLVSRASYRDFQVRAEFWAEPATNSGIFIRMTNPPKLQGAYEVNIYDQREGPEYGTGAIVNVAKVNPVHKAGGRWNTMEITARGPEMAVVLNGVEVSRGTDAKFAQGPIALQFGNGPKGAPGGAIKWRRIEVRAL